jgi:hypothetical protein
MLHRDHLPFDNGRPFFDAVYLGKLPDHATHLLLSAFFWQFVMVVSKVGDMYYIDYIMYSIIKYVLYVLYYIKYCIIHLHIY